MVTDMTSRMTDTDKSPEESTYSQRHSPVESLYLEKPANETRTYPCKRQRIITCVIMAVVCFLPFIDDTVISTAIPSITNDFDRLADVGYYGSSFLALSAATQLPWGKLRSKTWTQHLSHH